MIVRRLTSTGATAPTQGTAYTVGSTLGTGTVIYNGSATSFNDTGLTPGTSYTYTFYSENWNYYSPGATATATTTIQTSAANDHFRSLATGNWSIAGTWESSPNNVNWITSTLIPGSTVTSVTILSGHNITLDANVTVPGLTINSGGTFTASDATARTLIIAAGGTLTNNGTFTSGIGTVNFAGTGIVDGTVGFNNVNIAGGVNFGSELYNQRNIDP